MLSKLKQILVLLAVLLPGMVFSQNKTGTAGLTALKLDVSARANALGGSFIGLADDASALYYNPAGMVNLNGISTIATHNLYLAETQFSYLGVVFPLKSMSAAFGIQTSYFSSGDMVETTPAHSGPDGTGRTFGAYDLMIGASYAQMLTQKFSVGGTLKFISEGLADEKVYTVAGDVGTYYNTNWKSLVFGMSIRNFGGTVKFINEETDLPMQFVFGIAVTPIDDGENKLNVLCEAGHPADNGEYVLIGAEYAFSNMFFLRVGRKIDGKENWFTTSEMNKDVNFEQDADGSAVNFTDDGFNWNGTSLGVGFKMESLGLAIDYSWESYGYLKEAHMITLGYTLK